MAYSAIFAVVVGLGMIGQWSFSYLSELTRVPGPR